VSPSLPVLLSSFIQHSEPFKNLDKMLQKYKEKVGEIFQEPKQNLDDMLSRAQNRFAKVAL
jgi:hypothetical protein